MIARLKDLAVLQYRESIEYVNKKKHLHVHGNPSTLDDTTVTIYTTP